MAEDEKPAVAEASEEEESDEAYRRRITADAWAMQLTSPGCAATTLAVVAVVTFIAHVLA